MASSRKGEPDPGGAIAAVLARHLPSGVKLAVGYSGGLDSVVLLHALAALRGSHAFSLTAAHVHHGLSPHADAWADHCQAVCDALAVPLVLARVQVCPAGEGLEAAARKARYSVFAQLNADALLLAHHRDDQAETVLLQLRRGASMRGMAAMPEARPLTGRIQLLRPFLHLTRIQLEQYARAHGLTWVEDESNLDPSLARNHVRNVVLPALDGVVPGMSRALAGAAEQFAEWANLLDELADGDSAVGMGTDGLEVARLMALSEPRARNLLRRVLEQAGVQVRRHPLVEATRQLRDACPNAQVRVDFGDASVVRFRGRVHVVPGAVFAPVPTLDLPWRGEAFLDLGASGRLLFRPDAGEGVSLEGPNVRVRLRQPGDRMRLRAGQVARPLKDLLREAGIPPWRRPWVPVLEADGRIAWVAVLGAAAEFKSEAATPGWAISWVSPW
jgi:tRNA(Ile)-lysidine synthase